jgi:hypothetical protein
MSDNFGPKALRIQIRDGPSASVNLSRTKACLDRGNVLPITFMLSIITIARRKFSDGTLQS